MELIIRATFIFTGGGEGGAGRGYTEGVITEGTGRVAEKALSRWMLTAERERERERERESVCVWRGGVGVGEGLMGEGRSRGERESRSADPWWSCCPGASIMAGWDEGLTGSSRRDPGHLAGARTPSYLMASKELSFVLELLCNPSKQESDIIRF